jgi:hypothetical protein
MAKTMSDRKAASHEPQRAENRRNFELRGRVERFRGLKSAWAALASSCLAAEKRRIGMAGRAINDQLAARARQGRELDDCELDELDGRIDAFEREMRDVALDVSLAQLRSTLPERAERKRRSVLDLLDLLLGAEIDGLDGTESRILVIDYIVTLLCTTNSPSDAAHLHDPVTLTPRMYGLCERSDIDYDERLPEIEAEFYAAADLYEADTRSDSELRALARRKMELGPSYFAPGVLRAVTAYNAALTRRIAEQVESSQDWGDLASEEAELGGVFEAPVLTALASALRRRSAGDAPTATPIDRIAWCLDLSYLDASERKAVLADSVGQRDDVMGTTILVGLLSRSAVVLEDEFPAIGISPKQLSDEWIPELDDALKYQTQQQLAGDDYQKACTLSELKNKFLYAPMIEVNRKNRGSSPSRPAANPDAQVGRSARELAREALEADPAVEPIGLAAWRSWPWQRLGRIAAMVAATAVLVGVAAHALRPPADVTAFSSDQLLQTSPYLLEGKRNGQGSGPAFVGTLDPSWSALTPAEREEAAASLVSKLRARGVNQVMIYDEAQQLRIQSLSGNRVRVVADDGPRLGGR